MHRRSLIVLVLLTLVAVPVFADHSWGPYHWARTSNPFTLKVNENLTSNWEPYLATAATDWNQSTVLDLNVLWNNPISNPRKCSSVTGQIEICNKAYGFNGWLGIAGISITGGEHITKGYTKLNDSYFNTSTYNTPAWRQFVTCQEIGHDFGLDHQDENFDNPNLGTCMDYTSNPGTNQHPNAHDYDQLKTIYAHLDSFTTITGAIDLMTKDATRPRNEFEIIYNAGQWGTPIGFDGAGRPNVFVMPVPNHEDPKGSLDFELTTVTWAPIPVDRDMPGHDNGTDPIE